MRRLAAVLVCLLTTAPAFATQDAWPAIFSVSGVAADDVLNIRAAPSAEAEIVGTLAHDATGIEVIRPNDRQTWGLVNTGEGTGWVSLSYLTRGPGQWLGAFPEVRACFGTEPFWTLTVDPDGAAAFLTPDQQDATGRISDQIASDNRRDRHAFSGILDADGSATAVRLIVRQDACTDGMSDRAYGLSADLLLELSGRTRLLSGCCTLSDR